jgi:hypothetical protein
VPELQTGKTYYDGAEDAAAERYTSVFAKTIHERWLWASLHGLVAAIGLGLMALAA